jgi:stearoyl-CoA desaturase (delta-9 desaturase)
MLLWAGFLRVVLSHHTTFTINSLAHKFGRQPYSDRDSSKDVWWLAPFLCGESYHNYHHSFQADYRNGIRWYHWDPAKWALWLCSHTPLVSGLHRTPPYLVVKARAEMDFKRLREKMNRLPSDFCLPLQERLLKVRQGLEEAALQWAQAKKNYLEFRRCVADRSRESLHHARQSLKETERAFKENLELWKKTIREVGRGLTSGSFSTAS